MGVCCNKSSPVWSPLVVDIDGVGYPASLAGPNSWTKGHRISKNFSAYRMFAIDGKSPQLVEWLAPKVGILVYAPGGKCPTGIITGKNLFGNVTGGNWWLDGYTALASLDKEHKGYLAGDDLKEVYVWVNKERDAIAHPGELRPASEVFSRLEVNPRRQGGNAWFESSGATLKNGRKVGTWDWWPGISYEGLVLQPEFRSSDAERMKDPAPVIYFWKHTDGPFGFLRFFKVGKSLYVATCGPDFGHSGAMAIAPVTYDGKRVYLTVSSKLGKATASLKVEGVNLNGDVTYSDEQSSNKVSMTAHQLLPPIFVRPDVAGPFAYTDAAFASMVKANPDVHMLYITKGYPTRRFGHIRTLADLL